MEDRVVVAKDSDVCKGSAVVEGGIRTNSGIRTDSLFRKWSLSGGTMASKVLARLCFFPTLCFNVIASKFTSRTWYNRIDDNVVLGAIPLGQKHCQQLTHDLHLGAVVSLNENYELCVSNKAEEWQALGVEFLHLPTVDLSTAPKHQDLVTGVDFIRRQSVDNPSKSVYVHCKAGRSRSATLVGCYLIMRYNMTAEEAANLMLHVRPHVIMGDLQLEAMRHYNGWLKTGGNSPGGRK